MGKTDNWPDADGISGTQLKPMGVLQSNGATNSMHPFES